MCLQIELTLELVFKFVDLIMERIAEMNKIQNQDISESNAKLTNNYQSFLHQLNQEHILPDLYHNVQQPLMSADLMKDSFNAASSIHIYNKNPPTYIEHQSQSNVISNNSQNDALMVINSNQSLNKLQPDSVTLNVNSETLSTSNLEEEAFNDKLICEHKLFCHQFYVVKASSC